jgi:soluble lytic murein transglycosylase-like protein
MGGFRDSAPPRLAALLAALLAWAAAAAAEAAVEPGAADQRHAVMAMVAREARAAGVPVPLALAVAHAESYFNARALSGKGARGVMQIMPATSSGEYGVHPDRLWNARLNVRMGLHFLRRLIDRYGGRVDLALSHYNGGSGVGDGPGARVIPATRAYVGRVHALWRAYRDRPWWAGEGGWTARAAAPASRAN